MTLAASLALLLPTKAQDGKPAPFSAPKLSGYAMLQYQYSGQGGAGSNSFNVRMARLSLDGTILGQFAYKVQGQVNGNTSTVVGSPRIVDVWVEWQGLGFLKVRIGEFKRPFTFENPMNPIDQGFMSYGQAVTNLCGYNDRTGEHASNGRDIGLQLQGDFLRSPSGRDLLHYQVGVFNGQGINTKDVDGRKDLIGGLWVAPAEGLRIGAFGWLGSYARNGSEGVTSLRQRRYAISGEYAHADWTFRSEYIHSTGFGFKATFNDAEDLSNDEVDLDKGDKADGFYVLAIAPVMKERLHVKARYDFYRDDGKWGRMKSLYELGVDYAFIRNLQVSAEYAFVNDRSLASHNYHMADVEVSFLF